MAAPVSKLNSTGTPPFFLIFIRSACSSWYTDRVRNTDSIAVSGMRRDRCRQSNGNRKSSSILPRARHVADDARTDSRALDISGSLDHHFLQLQPILFKQLAFRQIFLHSISFKISGGIQIGIVGLVVDGVLPRCAVLCRVLWSEAGEATITCQIVLNRWPGRRLFFDLIAPDRISLIVLLCLPRSSSVMNTVNKCLRIPATDVASHTRLLK